MNENNKTKTIEEVRKEYDEQQRVEQHINFIKSMENKKFNELNIKQLTYLYEEHTKLYNRLLSNKELAINDLLTLDELKRKEKINKAKYEEDKAKFKKAFEEQESKKTKEQKRLEQLIDRAINETLKKHNLE